jgi:hypothetical protein
MKNSELDMTRTNQTVLFLVCLDLRESALIRG